MKVEEGEGEGECDSAGEMNSLLTEIEPLGRSCHSLVQDGTRGCKAHWTLPLVEVLAEAVAEGSATSQ